MPAPSVRFAPMTTPIRRRWRLFRRGVWYTLAGLLVALAITIGIGSQVLPMAERNPERIAAWLSARAQRPVTFDRVETEWTRRGPLLRLDNLRVGDTANPLHLGDAEILVSQYAGLLPGRSFTELRVRGLDLTVLRDPAGRWSVRGLPGQQQAQGDPLETLERLGELQVSDARMRVLAPELGIDLAVPRVELRLRVDGSRVRAGAKAWLQVDGTPLAAALDFDRSTGDGRVYAGTRNADLAEFSHSLRVAGIEPVSGHGRLQVWASLDAHRVVGVHAESALEDVVLRGMPGQPGQAAPTQALGIVSMDARWSGSIRQWHALASRLRLGEGASEQVLDGLEVDGGQRYGVRAERIDAAPLLAVAALGNGLPAGLRRWLLASKAGARVEQLRVRGVRGGALQVGARLRDLQFASVGRTPGMRGVGATLQGDASALQLRFDPASSATFDWPTGFGVAHAVTLDGDAIAWREGSAWNVRTAGLAIAGEQLRLNARGGVGFPGDGTRPRLDLAVDIGNAPVLLARQFWVHHAMRKTTIDWLNAALQGGSLRDVHAVIAGDLDDWPFRAEAGKAGAGKFRVDARIADATLKFHREWPAAEAVNADVRFEADGFSIEGRARIAGVPVQSFSGGIEHFRKAELRLDANTAGNAADLLAMLRQSPLQKVHGETLRNLQVAGPSRADFHLFLPFHKQVPMRLGGEVALDGASLREQRWKLAFDNVRGKATYDRSGFLANGLQVSQDGVPGLLSLRAGAPHVRDARQAFEAELQASLGIDELLDQAVTLAWLKPYMQGRSPWTVAVQVPRGAKAQALPTTLQLRSSLVGTSINLPEPVRKPAAQALAASVDLSLPLDRGEVGVVLGNLLSLRSRSGVQQSGVRIQFGGGAAQAPPASGLMVGGRVERLDALDWIGVVKEIRGSGSGSGSGSGRGMPLGRVDVQARQLRLLGSSFADTRLLLVPAPRGIAVQVQGPGLAGSLLVPEQDGATVAGRFERLHWRMPVRSSVAAVAATAHVTSPANPANIPPMLFDVGDLRIGDASLGTARFRSTPTAAGLRMDEFVARSAKQRLLASGSWTGRGATARTQVALNVESDDVGALLAGFGLGGQVAGGRGVLGIDAAWRGGPDALDPNSIDASLALDARDGRLLELEPGAGRVLGLLGIAQLPRRLTLDFRDFFEKGFAFDSIKGDVRLARGSARTTNLAIKGPAADINVRGSADLRRQVFDQSVEVLPKSGGLLTAVGALAGGPVGAAVGAMANAVLEKPLQGLGARTYRVTGPWQSPKVEVSARGPSAQRRVPSEKPPG